MSAPASRAARIEALVASAALSDDQAFDLRVVDGLVTEIDAALARIDADSLMPPAEQLATLAVGAVRGLMPVLRVEAEEQVAKAERKAARAAAESTR